MAFVITDETTKLSQLPTSLDGIYLLPYTWLKYGLEEGHIIIEDNEFYDSLQGSLFLAVEERHGNGRMSIQGNEYDIALSYVPSNKLIGIHPVCYRNTIDTIEGEYYKTKVMLTSVEHLLSRTPNEQKTINNSLIQLMKGCRIGLKHSVWKKTQY